VWSLLATGHEKELKKAILGRLPQRWESGVSFNQAALHAVVEGLHVGHGVPVRYCDRVETMVNNTCFFECNELRLGTHQVMVCGWRCGRVWQDG
jgi:hypothetical protein